MPLKRVVFEIGDPVRYMGGPGKDLPLSGTVVRCFRWIVVVEGDGGLSVVPRDGMVFDVARSVMMRFTGQSGFAEVVRSWVPQPRS